MNVLVLKYMKNKLKCYHNHRFIFINQIKTIPNIGKK